MNLTQRKLKYLFDENFVILFGRSEKLNSKELLLVKKNLFEKKINLKFISKNHIKHIFSDLKNQPIFHLFKGEMIILFSENLKLFDFYNRCKSTSLDIHFYCLYIYSRFFPISDIFEKKNNLNILYFLKQILFFNTLKTISLLNYGIVNIIKKKLG